MTRLATLVLRLRPGLASLWATSAERGGLANNVPGGSSVGGDVLRP